MPELRAAGSEARAKDFPSWWWVLLEKTLGIPSLDTMKDMPPPELWGHLLPLTLDVPVS